MNKIEKLVEAFKELKEGGETHHGGGQMTDVYAQKCHAEYCAENPSYFGCVRKDIARLTDKARKEADEILDELSMFYKGDIGIEIGTKQHGLTWSITGRLTVNGKTVKIEDPCDFLFLDLNNLMLKRMLDGGILSK